MSRAGRALGGAAGRSVVVETTWRRRVWLRRGGFDDFVLKCALDRVSVHVICIYKFCGLVYQAETVILRLKNKSLIRSSNVVAI